MAFISAQDELWKCIQGVVEDEGVSVYDIEIPGPARLRLTITGPSKLSEDGSVSELAVSSEDCSRVCRRLMVFFTVEGPRFGLSAEPEIEVSSPGVDRALRLPHHFAAAVGKRVKVVSGSQVVIGRLGACAEEQVSVEDERTKEYVELPLSMIKRANVEFTF